MAKALQSVFQLDRQGLRLQRFHVLVEGEGIDCVLPGGGRAVGFQVWRLISASSPAEAERAAIGLVRSQCGRGSLAELGLAPRLRVAAISRLGWLAGLAARETEFEFRLA